MTKYIDTAEQAKMIRKDLKVAFPATIFGVTMKRYSGGSSITVRWTDGPTSKDVAYVTDYYQARGGVDMSDYWSHRILVIGGEQVSFGGSISLVRHYSVAFYRRQLGLVAAKFGVETVEVTDSCGDAYAPDAWRIKIGHSFDLQSAIHQHIQKTRAADCRLGKMPTRPVIESVREV